MNFQKKIIISTVIILALNTNAVYAKDFSLRNEIQFGDSIKEVKEKETLDFLPDDQGSESSDETDESSQEETEFSDRNKKVLQTVNGTIAGIEDSFVAYWFDKNDKLVDVRYNFRMYESSDNGNVKKLQDNDYTAVNNSLIRQYGDPIGLTDMNTYPFTEGVLKSVAGLLGYVNGIDGVGEFRDYDEWALEDLDEDYNVKIEHCDYYFGTAEDDATYAHCLSYVMYTDEDLEAAVNEVQTSDDSIDGDL